MMAQKQTDDFMKELEERLAKIRNEMPEPPEIKARSRKIRVAWRKFLAKRKAGVYLASVSIMMLIGITYF